MTRQRRLALLLLVGSALYFFTSMSKAIIPGAVFDQLLGEWRLSVREITALGAAMMYAYSCSQIFLGVFSDRYGGPRLLCFGALLFTAGMLGFPLFTPLWLRFLCRIIVGVGAGTVFLGVAKLISEVATSNFTFVLGVVVFVNYMGTTFATLPFVWLVKRMKLVPALLLPGFIALAMLAAILLLSHGIFKPPVPGSNLQPVKEFFSRLNSWRLSIASAIIYGSFYAILTNVGQKLLQDYADWDAQQAAALMSAMTIILAVTSFFNSAILRLFGNRRRVCVLTILCFAFVLLTAAALILLLGLPGQLLALPFLLLALPAGSFSIFGTMIKELNPPSCTGFSIAALNSFAALAIAAAGTLCGAVLSRFAPVRTTAEGVQIFSGTAYGTLFAILAGLALFGLIFAWRLPETLADGK